MIAIISNKIDQYQNYNFKAINTSKKSGKLNNEKLQDLEAIQVIENQENIVKKELPSTKNLNKDEVQTNKKENDSEIQNINKRREKKVINVELSNDEKIVYSLIF